MSDFDIKDRFRASAFHFTRTPEQIRFEREVKRNANRERLKRVGPAPHDKFKGSIHGVCLKGLVLRVMGSSVAQAAAELDMPNVVAASFDMRLRDSTRGLTVGQLRTVARDLRLASPDEVRAMIIHQVRLARERAGWCPKQ